jgi:hypothetical protein
MRQPTRRQEIRQKKNTHIRPRNVKKKVVVRKDRESSPQLPLIGNPSKRWVMYKRRAVRKPYKDYRHTHR